ncbi:MAG: thiamine-phosphate kinase [Deltaproteobacteria bacterium]|nr:thiamine-phosphate kinase [Deltaproteobacteria bacterium]
MKLSELGEFGLINRLTREAKNPNIVVGIGDDAAVLRNGEEFILYTTDMLMEGDHFRMDWATPEQIGRKAMACNISDIAAMGGVAEFALVSIALTDNIDVETVEGIYRGMHEVANRHGVEIIGGDTTHGRVMVLNVVVTGKADEENLSLRSGAKVGDYILVTGPLGGSRAGLELLLRRLREPERPVRKHLDPGCRMDIAYKIAPIANAMIDVSDGLASEVGHICERSGVGAVVEKERITLSEETIEAGRIVGKDPYGFALKGGEDFELVFTVSPGNLERAKRFGTVVGRIAEREKGIHLVSPDGKITSLEGGYDHFRNKD